MVTGFIFQIRIIFFSYITLVKITECRLELGEVQSLEYLNISPFSHFSSAQQPDFLNTDDMPFSRAANYLTSMCPRLYHLR